MSVNRLCEGSMYPQGVANRPIRGHRVECPVCGKNLAAVFRALGPRGSCSGVESYVPNHAAQKVTR